MKISKLFHWLYAILMLLPVFFIGFRCGYVMWNKNAKDSYSDNQNLTSINSNNLVITERYYASSDLISVDRSYTNTTLFVNNFVDNTNNFTTAQQERVYKINFYANSDPTPRAYFYDINNNGIGYINLNSKTLNFNFEYINVEYAIGALPLDNYITLYTINNYKSLDNAFSYSVSQLNENVLFSWAKDSFIVEPFTYITGLFGMPSDSPVLTLLSYWCSISLIWLTFDLLMYVPLLVHRWLDKGVLE